MNPPQSPPLQLTHRADGAILVHPTSELGPYPESMTARLILWAQQTPNQPFIARRDASGAWNTLTYAATLLRVRQLAATLLPMNLSPERPVAILSGNSLEHALLGLACMYIGVPHAPVSTAYSTVSSDHAKLKHVLELLTPGVIAVFADSQHEHSLFERALSNAAAADATIMRQLPAATANPAALAAADAANTRVNGDTIAKFLLTSGSTGTPKAVVTTQRMWCSIQQMLLQAFPFLVDEPPVMVDWLPWNHVFGGNHNFGLALYNGGTFYIDDGRPVPNGIEQTLANLRAVSPTLYLNVPKGFETLVHHLEHDEPLRRNFFRRLRYMIFGGAMVSEPVLERLDAIALATVGHRVPMLCGLGATETAPCVCFTTPEIRGSGRIGLPMPGNLLKLKPVDGKFELCVKGPNVTPGYWRRPELTRAAFDDEGYYGLGDAVKFVDINQPELGLLFDGRIAEDFKLGSGTWVSVGPLRTSITAALSPLIQDVVIAGLNRDFLSALLVLDVQACRAALAGVAANAPLATLAQDPALRALLLTRLRTHAKANPGSSTRVARFAVLDTPLSLDLGEVTDKGSTNQRAVLKARAELVEVIFTDPPDSRVLSVLT
jgi:feruloyl-CoA synthase